MLWSYVGLWFLIARGVGKTQANCVIFDWSSCVLNPSVYVCIICIEPTEKVGATWTQWSTIDLSRSYACSWVEISWHRQHGWHLNRTYIYICVYIYKYYGVLATLGILVVLAYRLALGNATWQCCMAFLSINPVPRIVEDPLTGQGNDWGLLGLGGTSISEARFVPKSSIAYSTGYIYIYTLLYIYILYYIIYYIYMNQLWI